MQTSPDIEFKGTGFTLTVIKLGSNSLEALQNILMDKIAKAPHFFNCAPVVVDVSQADDELDFAQLKEVVEGQDFVPVGVTACRNQQQKDSARSAGLAVMTAGALQSESRPANPPTPAPQSANSATKVVHGHVRSGQQVYADSGDLVIVGSVSNGAEVIADGDIHIYGALRGRAIAGAKGIKQAKIFCQDLQAELVSIAGTYLLNEQMVESLARASVIHIEQDKLVIRPLA